MKPTKLPAPFSGSIWDGEPEPDVWYGPDGIDAMIYTDPWPYADPLSGVLAEAVELPSAGDAR